MIMVSVVLQAILNEVEQFQSEVRSVLTAEHLDANNIQQLLDSSVIAKIDLPQHIELQRVTMIFFISITDNTAAQHYGHQEM